MAMLLGHSQNATYCEATIHNTIQNTMSNNVTSNAAAVNATSLRQNTLAKIKASDTHWDIIIAGGGITGAGIAREAARRGFKVLLVERQDFAWGTSSRSSKMVHGGLRYLGQGDYKTTMHSVRERERLLGEAAGLVDEMPYLMAHYKGVFPPPWAFNLLLRGYDFFAGKKYRQYHKKQDFINNNPEVKQEGLLGATQFADAVTDDSRLVMRVLHEAMNDGATILNYLSVSHLIKNNDGQVTGVKLTDEVTGDKVQAFATTVVSATGAWADELRQQATTETVAKKIRPCRGSHIVIARDKIPTDHVYTLMHPQDKRALFIFPWETRVVIGTTDLDHPNLENKEVGITQEELEYLLVASKDLFPDANITKDDVICSWAGVRPLISSAEDGKKVDPSKEKREHSIWEDKGLITVSGGKLTTFRIIALDVLKKCQPYLSANASNTNTNNPINIVDDGGNIFTEANSTNISHPSFSTLDSDIQQRLLGHYGLAVDDLLTRAKADEISLIPDTNTLWAELRYAATHEYIQHLDDLLLRRTRLGLLLENGGMNHEAKLKDICQEALGWDDARWLTEAERYTTIWQTYYYLPTTT